MKSSSFRKVRMLRIDNSDDDWIICFVEKGQFKGSGDPNKLDEIIKVFRKWVENNSNENS